MSGAVFGRFDISSVVVVVVVVVVVEDAGLVGCYAVQVVTSVVATQCC